MTMNTAFNKWIIKALLLSLVIPGIVAGINGFMDPLWYCNTSHRFNQKQEDFNERQQKTNFITFHDFDYDGLIIGSSTSTSMNQHHFKGIRVYNYAINALQPLEYVPYIRYAREHNGKGFKYIFVGLDFLLAGKLPPPPFDPEKIFADTNKPLYRIKTLISLDTLMFSRKTFMNYLYKRHIYYDRDNVKHTLTLRPEELRANIATLMKHFEKSPFPYSFNNYKYSSNSRDILQSIRDDNPGAVIVPFTTPVIDDFMVKMVRNNLLDDYERWIRDIVAVNGVCYNFMYPNTMSADPLKYFHDPNHTYPFVADMMIDTMYNKKVEHDTEFCIYITRRNLEEKILLLRRLFRELEARSK
ncbi:MAG TPA: hypothetical protein PKX40_13820 [Spirochaetota bacterium]|nr:hypothetical protein [Spirochaetota bacterium]